MKLHYLQIHDGAFLSVNQRKCIASVQRIATETDNEYEMISIPKQNTLMDALVYSNQVRMDKARTVPNLCYVDTDCFLTNPFIPEGDTPWFGRNEYEREHDVLDIFYFFVNGNTEWFDLYMQKDKVAGGHAMSGIMLSDNLKQFPHFGFIPGEYFLHLYTTSSKIIAHHSNNEEINNIQLACHKRLTELSAMIIKLKELSLG